MRLKVAQGGYYCPFPVGSWLHCEHDPNSEWPGTSWTRWDEGTYLVSSGTTYKDLSNYGENEHVLTVAEMPTHTHVGYGNWACVASGPAVDGMAASWGTGNIATIHDTLQGGGAAHNNMPRSVAVPLWRREK